jgi:hypothetical protein
MGGAGAGNGLQLKRFNVLLRKLLWARYRHGSPERLFVGEAEGVFSVL